MTWPVKFLSPLVFVDSSCVASMLLGTIEETKAYALKLWISKYTFFRAQFTLDQISSSNNHARYKIRVNIAELGERIANANAEICSRGSVNLTYIPSFTSMKDSIKIDLVSSPISTNSLKNSQNRKSLTPSHKNYNRRTRKFDQGRNLQQLNTKIEY